MCVEPHSVYMFVYDLKVPGFTSQIDLVDDGRFPAETRDRKCLRDDVLKTVDILY